MLEKFKFIVRPLLTLSALLFTCIACLGADQKITLAWNPSKGPDVRGYVLHYGVSSGDYLWTFDMGLSLSVIVPGLEPGQVYYFAVSAFDKDGNESVLSNEVWYITPGAVVVEPGNRDNPFTRVSFPVIPNHWYQLQAADDLFSWRTVWLITATQNEWKTYYDPLSVIFQSRSYRLITH